MHIKKLHLVNWCQHADLEVVLHQGVNGLVGANGNGKSNFLDAGRFLFTGESVNPGGKEDNLRWGQKSGSVTAVVCIGDVDYTLSRNIHNSGVRMTWVDPGTKKAMDIRKSTEMQAEINRLLCTNPAVLLDAVFVPQGKIDGILFQKNTERLKEFQQAFGLAAAGDAFRILSDEVTAFQLTPGLQDTLNDAVTRFRATVTDLARIEEELRDVQTRITALAPHEAVLRRRDQAQQHNAALDQSALALSQARKTRDQLVVARDKAQAALQAQLNALAGADALLPGLRQKYAELMHLKANFDRYTVAMSARTTLQATLGQLAVITDEDVATLAAKELEASNLVQQIRGMLNGSVVRPQVPEEVAAQKAFQEISLAIQVRQGKGVQWSPELTALSDRARDLKNHIDHFATGKCPTCGQDVLGGPAEAAKRQAEYAAVVVQSVTMANAEKAAEQAALTAMQSQANALNEQLRGFRDACIQFLNQQLLVAQGALDAAQAATRNGRALLGQRKQIMSQLGAYEVSMGAPVLEPSAAEIIELGARITGIENAVADLNAVRQHAATATQAVEMQEAAVEQARRTTLSMGVTLDLPGDAEIAAAQAAVPVLLTLRGAEAKLQSDAAMTTVTRDARDRECKQLQNQIATEAKHAAWVQLVKESRDVLHVGQLPKLIMQEYGKILNGQLDYYLEKFQAPMRVWLNDDLEFRSSKNSEAEMDAQRLSGAEKIVGSVSFRMAMSDTFARQVGLLVLDEPSNYLDDTNIQNLQMVLLELKKMSAHTGRQVLVVTHEDKLMGFFDHCVTVGSTKEE